MTKTNWYINIGVGFVALAILLKISNLDHNAITFTQGFSIGLGLILIVRGLLATKKERNK